MKTDGVVTSKNYSTVNGRQSYVQKTGRQWEDKVKDSVNEKLKTLCPELTVIRGSEIPKHSDLWDSLSIPAGEKGSGKRIWGDIDLVVLQRGKNPVGVISCKTSLHGRLSETLFYALVLKDLVADIKILFATPDKGRQPKSGIWISEWGSAEKPTKDRLLGSYYLDGIYVQNNGTKLGGIVKSLSELPKDLAEWHFSKNGMLRH